MGDSKLEKSLSADIPVFLGMAGKEGWICDPWELELLLQSFPKGCLVRREEGHALGFVTSMAYEKSGWVGNLIVDARFRGRGMGRALINEAVSALENSGVKTVWLTASPSGAPLYRTLGFVEKDSISRWHSRARSGPVSPPVEDRQVMALFDREGWGDDRGKLLGPLSRRGELFCSDKGFLIRYPYGEGMVLGPWGAAAPEDAASILEKAVATAGGGENLYLDVPDKNANAALLLERAGFNRKGTTLLMFRGEPPDYRPGLIYGLASMGSMG